MSTPDAEEPDPVSAWIEGLRRGDDAAAAELWRRYFRRLVEVADRRLPSRRRDFDEEDVAVSAFRSLCRGVRDDRFPDLREEGDLWSLLVVITARKAARRRREAAAQKRGGGQVRGESVMGDLAAGIPGLDGIVGEEPSPQFAAEVAEESERLLGFLEDDQLRDVALAKLEGLSHEEIALRFDCSVRTVERRVRLIRRLWTERG